MEHMGLIVLRWLKLKFTSISKEEIIAKDQIEQSLHPRTRSTITKCITTKKKTLHPTVMGLFKKFETKPLVIMKK